jgi:hypothetical protein
MGVGSVATQQKVQRLLEELRSWGPGEIRRTLRELSEEFDLEPFVVDQIARSDGIELTPEQGSDEPVADPSASTLDLDPSEVHQAVGTPEKDPSYVDRDSGMWRKKPTGEWERVSEEPED